MSSSTSKPSSNVIVTSAAATVAAVSAYFIVYKRRSNDTERSNLPPMAKVGVFETLKGISFDPIFLTDVAEKLNSYIYRLPVASIFGYSHLVCVGEPKVSKAILADQTTIRPVDIYKAFDAVTSNVASILTSDEKDWHSRRKGVAPAFATKHVRRMNEVAAKKVEEWIETKLSKFIQNDKAFDVGEEMIDITLSTIAEAAFEYKISDTEKQMFLRESGLCFEEFGEKSFFNPFRPLFGFFLKDRQRAFVASSRIKEFALKIINEYRNCENPTKDTIIELIVKNKAYENDEQRAADVIILFVAGHDTTAYSIAWTLKELAKNPLEQQKLRDSLARSEQDKWHQSDVLRKIVKEGMRLHPVAARGAIRVVKKDFVSDSGSLIPKDSLIFLPINMATWNTKVFDDANEFIPSRWDDPSEDMNDAFLPFAAGKQNCVGQSLANAEMHNVIPKICSKCELELYSEGEARYSLTYQPYKTLLKAKYIN